MSYHVLQLLLEYQNESAFHGDLCEIGVWRGDTFALLAAASQGDEKTIAIDIGETWLRDSSSLALRVCTEHGHKPTICCIQGSSSHPKMKDLLRKTVGSNGIRFAHIDGEHSRELAFSDASLIEPLMAPWGLICFDDCLSIVCPGIAQALFEFSAKSEWLPVLFTPNKSYLCHRRYFKTYRSYVSGIADYLASRRSIPASMSSSSYYPDEGFISIFTTPKPFYQVVNMKYSSYKEYIQHRPQQLDINTCKILD